MSLTDLTTSLVAHSFKAMKGKVVRYHGKSFRCRMKRGRLACKLIPKKCAPYRKKRKKGGKRKKRPSWGGGFKSLRAARNYSRSGYAQTTSFDRAYARMSKKKRKQADAWMRGTLPRKKKAKKSKKGFFERILKF